MATTTTKWAHRIEAATLAEATNGGERWTRDDLAFVVAFTDDVSDEELALTLGRSLYALWAIQARLRNEGVEGVMATFDVPGRVTQAARIMNAPTYTFIGDDVPPGW